MSDGTDDDDLLDEFGLGFEELLSNDKSSQSPQSAPALRIDLQVNFVQTGTFMGALYGKALT